LHIECKPLGIDVCAIHPSPVASNFYSNLQHKVDMIEAAAKSAVSPDSVADPILKSVGACAWRDVGGTIISLSDCCFFDFLRNSLGEFSFCFLTTGMAIGTRMGTFFLPFNFFSELFAAAAPFLPDWKRHNKHR